MGMIESFLAGAIMGLVVKRDGQEPIIVPVKVSGEGGAEIPIPLPVTIVGGQPGLLPVGYVLESIADILARDMPCRAATTTYYVDNLMDARLAQKVLLILVNTGNQAVTVQVVGHSGNSPSDVNGLVNLGSTYSLAANGGKLGFGISLETSWYPWLGVTVLTGASPLTAGTVQVMAYGQRWVKKEA